MILSTLHAPMHTPLYEGTAATTSEVPGRYMVALGGRGFNVDLAINQFRRESVPLLRQQADQSDQPAEASINPEDLWRRSVTSWHHGAGQRNLDGPDSDPARFYRSKGVDVWEEGVVTLLPGTDAKRASAETNLKLAVAGGYLYLIDGASIVHTQDVSVDSPTWTGITGEPATAATHITSDGGTVYTAHGADGIYSTARGGASTASFATGTVAGCKYVKGRLFAWNADVLYNVTGAGALPAALLDHPNADFDWVDVAEGPGFYYAAGFSGDKSLIYRTAVKADGTGLDTPVVAAELPDGEIIRSIDGYLGFLLIGTDKGVRFGAPDSSGAVTLGGLITDAPEVRCFEGQDRFVWFGWSQYDATSTGLGRMDLSAFNGTRPSYASDLMVTDDGDVLSVVTFGGLRVFTVSGGGVYAEEADLESTGTIETGRISYGIYDQKVSMYLTVSHLALVGEVGAEMARDGGDYVTIGVTNDTAATTSSQFSTNRARAEHFDLRLTLTADDDEGPTVGRMTLRSYPTANRSEVITLPLIIANDQRDPGGQLFGRDPHDDLDFLAQLEESGDSVLYQEGADAVPVVVSDHTWMPMHLLPNGRGFAGTYVVQLKRFATE